MKPGLKDKNPKNPKYHFEGTKQDDAGNTIYIVLEMETGQILEWTKATFNKNKVQIEY